MNLTVTADLTLEELTAIQAKGHTADEYAAVIVPAAGVQMAEGMDNATRQKVVIIQATVAIPADLIHAPKSGIIGVNGAALNMTKVMPAAPVVRVVLSRSCFAQRVLDAIHPVPPKDAGVEEIADIPPLPILRRESVEG